MARFLPLIALFLAPLAAAQDGMTVYTTDDTTIGAEIQDWFTQGTALNLYTETGDRYGEIQPLFAGVGGYFRLDAENGDTGFEIAGGTGAAGVRVTMGAAGGSRAVFDSGAAGTSAVVFPSDALDATELLDEPGVANNRTGSTIVLETDFNLTLSRTITAPTSGFVVALGTAEVQLNHATGTGSVIQISVADGIDCDATTPSAPAGQQTNVGLPSGAAAGLYRYTSTPQGVFTVDAGANTFCITAFEASGTDARIDDQNLTLMFFPTSYGTVLGNVTDGGGNPPAESDTPSAPPSAADVADERAASIQANEARLAAEVGALRARLDAIEREMEAGRDRQSGARE